MEDSALQRETWDSRIPVCFRLADDEVASIEQPKCIYMLARRGSYFPLVAEKVFRYMAGFVEKTEESPQFWLDHNGVPMRWYYPIGLLYDLVNTNHCGPWSLTVHTKNYPSDELLQCSSIQAVEAHFIQTLKQADQLKHRSHVINAIPKHLQKQLWNALVTERFDQFWDVNKLLMNCSEEEPIREIPLKLYRKNDYAFIQRKWPVKINGDMTLVEELFKAAQEKFRKRISAQSHHFICMGVKVPTETPLLWLYTNVCYPDNFLHICIIENSR